MRMRIRKSARRIPGFALALGLICLLATMSGCGNDASETPSGENGGSIAKPADNAGAPTGDSRRQKKKKRLVRKLSDFRLFRGRAADLIPADGAFAYEVNTPLFVDYTQAQRVIFLPDGQPATYHETNCFDFPTGTVLAKTLFYPSEAAQHSSGRRLVETRVLMRRQHDWLALAYVWNDEQTDADLAIAGAQIKVSWQAGDGATRRNVHIVPNANDCKRCHKIEDVVAPLGLTARNLNRDCAEGDVAENQLDRMARTGRLRGAPAAHDAPRLADWDDPESADVDARARAWLEVNCAHCHSPQGPARNSGLYLRADVAAPYRYGVLKSPVAAGKGSGGRTYDIVPGKPDESILVFRLEATEPGVLMPEYGRSLVDAEGVALIRQWITEMELPGDQQMVDGIGEFQSLSSEELAQFAKEVHEQGSPSRGEEVLHRQQMTCLKCHAIGGVGGGVGPDLMELKPETTLDYLVRSVLLPNHEIKKGFETIVVVTDDGQAISGVRVDETPSELILRDLTRDEIRIRRDTIEEQETGISLMPANAAAMLAREEFVDLVRFLWAIGQQEVALDSSPETVCRWHVLDPVPPRAASMAADDFVATVAGSAELIWEVAYSRLSGELRLRPPADAAETPRRFVQCEFDVVRAGTITVALDSVEGLSMWLDAASVAVEQETTLAVEAGRRTLTFMLEADAGAVPSLRCEIRGATEAPAVVRIVNE